ncbi:MAG: hypothetical protein R3F35_23045 [Myxococcota bacterium]
MGKAEIGSKPAPPGDRSPLRVTALASDGAGVARLPDGRVVFVESAAPGDLVVPGPILRRRGALRTSIERLVEPGGDRVEPRCDHFGSCGGCSWQHVRYSAQLDAKRRNVQAALERIGGLRLTADVAIVASPDDLHYRARTRVVEAPDGVGYRRQSSHAVLPVAACPVLVPAAGAALALLGDRVAAEGAAARRGARKSIREWTITAGSAGTVQVHPSGATDDSDEPLELEVLGERLQLRGAGFVQGNALLWDRLAREVRDRCLESDADRGPRRFVELYAGIGFLTLPIARAGLVGIAVESAPDAARDLAANLARAGLATAVEVVSARAEAAAALPDWLAASDLLLVDPPRVGLDAQVRETIARSGPPAIVYVSCDPATLARDVARLVAADYRLESVLALDLFPQTPHVETIVRLVRGGSPP